MIENTYGLGKRLDYIAGVIERLRPARVLDAGCGTGANLTAPLAGRFPATVFVGTDSDAASIAYARQANRHANVSYLADAEAGEIGTFDLVIASEVIEHVDDPDAFLDALQSRLNAGGKLLLTLPNGYGPFEFAALFEAVLRTTGIYGALRALKRALRGAPTGGGSSDTLAVSPHINFFSYRSIRELIAGRGLTVLDYRARTFLCGFGFDQILQSPRAVAWNAAIADRLPPQMVSDWMFLLEGGGARRPPAYCRGACARARRYLNERRRQAA